MTRPASRHAVALILAATFLASGAAAQDASSAAVPDSILHRLARAEEAIAALRQQIATQGEAGVRTKSGVQMELSGRVLMNAFSNTRKNNNFDVPYFVRPRVPSFSGPPAPPPAREHAGGISMRQTSLAGEISIPGVLGGAFTGDIEVDFFGGQMPSAGGRTFPLIRLRTARGIVKWSHGEWLMGQETVLISPQNPMSIASVGFPLFTGAGNLWLWLPQMRGTFEMGSTLRFALQGAVLAPTNGNAVGFFDTDADSAELTRTPFVQARARVAWGNEDTRGEIGFGIHRGRVATPRAGAAPQAISRHSSQATSVDFHIPVTHRVDIRGEGYRGQAVRGLGTGGIGQSLGTNGSALVPLKTKAGWVQLNLHPVSAISLGSGYGMDDPDDDRAFPNARLKNTTIASHITWRIGGPLIAGTELRQTTTLYRNGLSDTNHHVNLAFGFSF